MKKLLDLRRHLLAAVPALQASPERLLTFVEDGRVSFRRGTTYDHRYTYTARIIVTNYRGATDALMLPLLYWLSAHQPNASVDDTVTLEAEILDNDTVDLSLSVELDERVQARLDCDQGTIHAHHMTAAHPLPLVCLPERWQLYVWDHVNDDQYHLVAEWPATND